MTYTRSSSDERPAEMAAIKKKILNLKTPKTRAIAAKKDPT